MFKWLTRQYWYVSFLAKIDDQEIYMTTYIRTDRVFQNMEIHGHLKKVTGASMVAIIATRECTRREYKANA